MERVWVFESLAVTVADVDFLDPALVTEPGARERGVRVELRHVDATAHGSVYTSPALSLAPALCRIDLLESTPGAADRMHWHPAMEGGEPGDRVFETAMAADPVGWLAGRLRSVDDLLSRSGAPHVDRHRGDADAIAGAADEIVAAAELGLRRMREPWPVVRHDERGMAVAD